MNRDRLTELQRQRALVQEHLAWLDREIALQSSFGLPVPTLPVATDANRAPGIPGTSSAAVGAPGAADPLSDVHPDPAAADRSTRRGCFLVFAAGLLLFFGLLAVVYFWKYRDRPLLFLE